MRRTRFVIAGLGIATTSTLLLSSGCAAISHFDDDCENGGSCASYRMNGGPTTPTCTGTPTELDRATQKPKFLNAGCAVFAWAGTSSAKGTGTMEDPFHSLQDAAASANGRWVIACSKDDFKEEVSTTVSIYGGFDCTNPKSWTKKEGEKTNLLGLTQGKPTLTLKSANQAFAVLIEDFTITAPSIDTQPGMPSSLPGGSSIGVVVEDMDAQISRCVVTAGNAGNGAAGTTPTDKVQEGVSAMPDALEACTLAVGGGTPGQVSCDDGMSVGGKGGNGGQPVGMTLGPGQAGKDGDLADKQTGNGVGGAGATTMMPCVNGLQGKDSAKALSGSGSAAALTLRLDGVAGGEGGAGKPGERGHGGGGGGGALSNAACVVGGMTVPGPGASGGGGGSGGCGGKGGTGGKAGGSSIAIISLGARLKLTEVKVVSGSAGSGGGGGLGQYGASGGEGAAGGKKGSADGCTGGAGGRGGNGGDGGGGRGGYSLGIAWKVTPAVKPTFDASSKPGEAGKGGTSPSMTDPGNGKGGEASLCWDFSSDKNCAP